MRFASHPENSRALLYGDLSPNLRQELTVFRIWATFMGKYNINRTVFWGRSMTRWIGLILAFSSIVLYQNCTATHDMVLQTSLDSSATGNGEVNVALSRAFFSTSLYPITQQPERCAGCHGVNQQPLFATEDMAFSHDVILSFGLVDLRDPANSAMVQKLEGGHQGFDQTVTDQVRNAIQTWSDELIAAGGIVGIGDGVQPLYSSLFTNIFEPMCIECHSPDGEAPEIDYSEYVTTINTGGISPGSAATSPAYTYPLSGHPFEEALTPEELAALAEWINRGALNN
jgi:mono/diheme cytochrome c family protein